MYGGGVVSHSKKRANKACSGFLGVCGFDKHFSRFKFFLLSGIFLARPKSTNASRWLAGQFTTSEQGIKYHGQSKRNGNKVYRPRF